MDSVTVMVSAWRETWKKRLGIDHYGKNLFMWLLGIVNNLMAHDQSINQSIHVYKILHKHFNKLSINCISKLIIFHYNHPIYSLHYIDAYTKEVGLQSWHCAYYHTNFDPSSSSIYATGA